MAYPFPKSPVLSLFQLITGDGCDLLCSVSFSHQSIDFRGKPGRLRVSNSPFLSRCMKVGVF